MSGRRITYQNELHIMIDDYLSKSLEAELGRNIPALTEAEAEERRQWVRQVLEGRKTCDIPSAQVLHNVLEVWRACRPSIYRDLKRKEAMPLLAEKRLQEMYARKGKLPYNRDTTDMYATVGAEDPLTDY